MDGADLEPELVSNGDPERRPIGRFEDPSLGAPSLRLLGLVPFVAGTASLETPIIVELKKNCTLTKSQDGVDGAKGEGAVKLSQPEGVIAWLL